ncbi:hypothetical protein JTB14_004222 [Gonioctena quinquepunctata]|nr:hypothetical protein JTB14_004222 [Gonioctena quinquepunctata]
MMKKGSGLKPTTETAQHRVHWDDSLSVFESRIRTGVISNLKRRIQIILKKHVAVKANSIFCGEFEVSKGESIQKEYEYFTTVESPIYQDSNLDSWPSIIRPNPNFNQQRPSAIQQNPNFNKFSSQRIYHLNTWNPSADNYTDNYQEYQYSTNDNYTANYQEYQYSTNDNYTDDYQDSQNFGAESHNANYQEYQSNTFDFGYSETQPNQYENFQDFPIGPISFDPPINQSIDPTLELRAQVQALNISDNLNPNLNFPEQMFL